MPSAKNADRSTELHPWVKMTQSALEKERPGVSAPLLNPGPNRLHVLVTKGAISRSMAIWDRLLKAVEASGFNVRMEQKHPGRTIITVDGENLCVRVREKTTRSKHIPTPAELERMERLNLSHCEPTWDVQPTGKLVLTITYLNGSNETFPLVTWNDSGRKLLEGRLDTILDVLKEVANDLKRQRVLWEERERIKKVEEPRRQEAIRFQAEEKEKTEQLERQASAWTFACSMRSFIQAVREKATRRTGAVESGSTLDQWIQWAERHANSIDPVGTVLALAMPDEKGG